MYAIIGQTKGAVFQFLIGTVKTKSDDYFFICYILFQFLIGTVKTFWYLFTNNRPSMFQFLIGTVKTFTHYAWRITENTFQFLIGTVKTLESWYTLPYSGEVSIPHRYCKNPTFIYSPGAITLVSIPHRYCKNQPICQFELTIKLSFNSS